MEDFPSLMVQKPNGRPRNECDGPLSWPKDEEKEIEESLSSAAVHVGRQPSELGDSLV